MNFFRLIIIFSLMLPAASFASSQQQTVRNFAFSDVNGRQHRFSDYRGKWVLVNYWSMHCGPCLREIPALKSIAHHYRGRAVVLGMDAGETSNAQLQQFMRSKGINYTVAPTQNSTIFAMGLIYGVPTSFLVSPQGKIVDNHMGVYTLRRFQHFVNQQR